MILKEVLHMDRLARRWSMVRVSIKLSGGTDLTQQQIKPVAGIIFMDIQTHMPNPI